MATKTITVKLPPNLDRQLEKLSLRIKKTKSVVVRLAIQELLRQPDLEFKLSAYEMLSEFAGSIGELPADLSENAKYMKGYGQ